MSDQQSPIIQSVLEQAKQAFATQQAQLEQKAAAKQRQDEAIKQSFIDALKKQLEQDITHELFEFLQIEYKIHESGTSACRKQEAIACIKLPNEYDVLMAGYILAQSVTPNESVMQPGYRIIIPDLSQNNGSKTIYSDLSGGCNHYCTRGKLNESLLTLIGKWNNQVAQLKNQLEQQRKGNEFRRQQLEEQQAEHERLQAIQAQEDTKKQAVNDHIQKLVDALIAEHSEFQWQEGFVVTLYEWKWATSLSRGEETYADYQSCWSLNDQTDSEGYIVPANGDRPIKLSPGNCPRVYKTIVASTEDCERYGLLAVRPCLTILGVSKGDGSFSRWEWGGDYLHYWQYPTIPAHWIRKLMGAEEPIIRVKLEPPEGQEVLP